MHARHTLALVLVLASCDASPSEVTSDASETQESDTQDSGTEQPDVEPLLELEAGLTECRPLVDGDPVELVAGFQGGWHVDLCVRGEGLAPDGLWLDYEARDPQTGASLSYETQALLGENNVLWTDEGWLRLGDRVVFDIEAPEQVVGSEVCLFVEVDGESWSGEDSRCVTIVDEQP